ncbi:MAG: RsmB/NOP family class I SAM-dependent RNA methyltransferase [Lachnospiraceae bacterium]|nr:RsmB/NOP family class I SAM-dependent RNA methyltransferase [Lachnospiraceae bacterium]
MSVKERLPQEFIAGMRRQLGTETEEFLESYERESCAGIRVNTEKISVQEIEGKLPFLQERVPWTENGFYVKKGAQVSLHPYYFAGLYYMQEPSAMLPASRLPIAPGDMVLDLCAAPGGKATELSSRLKGSGLLVANDVSASRAKALLKNLSVWGASNICITAESPGRLLEAFGCFFDKILVDAPCSGEGMFRKDSSLISSWEKKGPEEYAPLQKEILSCAVQMLRPGGMLLYSTCTFSEKEDEEVIADALNRYPELSLVWLEDLEGFARGISMEPCIRIYPHRVRGEGHFLALLQKEAGEKKTETSEGAFSSAGGGSRIPAEAEAFFQRITDRTLAKRLSGWRFRQIGEQCLLLPPYDLPDGIRYLRTGLLAGTLKRGRFEPSQALAMLLDRSGFDTVLDLPLGDGRVSRYLKGETVGLNAGEEERTGQSRGAAGKSRSDWVLICVDGHGLGWGRLADGSIKNKYYPGWRMQ